MNKHNILGSTLLGVMLAFLVVMPAFASEDQSSVRTAIKACNKAAQVTKKNLISSAKDDLKLATKDAILAWKDAVASAKNLSGDERRQAIKDATAIMQAAIKQASKDSKQAERDAKESFRSSIKNCKATSSDDSSSGISLPVKFPSNMPIEKGATITQKYNAVAADGRYQATVVFITEKTLAENFALYSKYMSKNGWAVTNSIDNEDYKMLLGVKGNSNLQITMDKNSSTGVLTVSINLTTVK